MMAGEKIRLFPTPEQKKLFLEFCGAARFAYNVCLDYTEKVYKESGHHCSVQELVVYIQSLKYSGSYDWLLSIPEIITKQAIRDLDSAYMRFFKHIASHPKFKSKKSSKPSFYQRVDRFRMIDDCHIKLTGIKEPVRIRSHSWIAKVRNPRVSFDGKFWYFSYSYEIEPEPKEDSVECVGVDVGIKSFAVTSNNVIYQNINKTSRVRKLEKRLKHLQRRVSKKYEENKKRGVLQKTNNVIRLEQQIRLLHRQLRNIRNTYIHQVTYDLVKAKPGHIVIEDLNVRGMMKNRHLSKAVQQQGFATFRHHITYKCKAYGVDLIVADRVFASSKTCGCCGFRRERLSLSERTFICPQCGLSLDRDLNAAINLRNYGRRKLASAS